METNTDNSNNFIKKFVSVIRKMQSMREFNVFVTIIFISVLLSFMSRTFLTPDNLRTTAIGFSADGIIGIGMTIALVSGGFDLSVGSIFGLSGVMTGMLYIGGMNIGMSAFLAFAVSLLLGLTNGIFIGKIGINPFITTLAMMGIARGMAYALTQGTSQTLAAPDAFKALGRGEFMGIPVFVIIFFALAILFDFMMRKTSFMRKVFYTGSSEKAALLSGINASKVKILVFVLTAVLSSIAGIISLARFGTAIPTSGQGAEMRVISAAVIGGSSIKGGEGTVLGTVLGTILLSLINNGLILMNASVYYQSLLSGVILLVAVTIDHVSHNKRLGKTI